MSITASDRPAELVTGSVIRTVKGEGMAPQIRHWGALTAQLSPRQHQALGQAPGAFEFRGKKKWRGSLMIYETSKSHLVL